jgi:hypothetical protein
MKTQIVKLKRAAVMMGIALSGIGWSGAMTPASALTFNFTLGTGVAANSAMFKGFTDAGALWSSAFTNNVTLDFTINFTGLDTNTLGETSTITPIVSYGEFYTALASNSNPLSADDTAAIKSLSPGSTFNLLLNRTTDSPKGSGSVIPYLDNNGTVNVDGDGNSNNNSIALTNANAKILGIAPAGSVDANISLNSLSKWDFDPTNGIDADSYDFVGVAAHEIGHALGFFSGVDALDDGKGTLAENDTFVLPLDLFRYSSLSNDLALNTDGTIDFTADARNKYFSLDGGKTAIASFATGVNFGDGNQAGHWQENVSANGPTGIIGIMDPATALGERITISETDLRAFDAIGWNRAAAQMTNNSVNVPEPANFVGTFIFAAFGIEMVLKRRQKLFESTTTAATEQA